MADTMVGDIVGRLKIDTAEWQRGLQQATAQLTQFQQGIGGRLNPALQQTNQALAQTGTQAQAMATHMQSATRATSAWSQALQIAGGIGIATSIQGMVSALASFAAETIRTGARLEQLRASLSALAGSSAAGQQQFDSLFQTAQRLGVPFEALARGWRTLTAAASQAGLPLNDQRRLLEAVATEGRRVGASNEELSRAFLALGQMASKGTVSMEELRQQLGEALPTALAAMAQGMGRTTEELIKLVEAGGVRFPTAARALTRGLEDMQRQGMQTGDTLQMAFNRFGNEVVRARDELARMAGPLKTATDLATNFLKVLSDSAQAQRQLQEARAGEARIGTNLREGDISRLPAEQQRRLTVLNRLMAEQVLAQGDPNAPPMFQPTREEYIAQLKAERDAIFQSAQAIKSKNDEQIKATGEINKATADQKLQRDTITDLTKQMDALSKAQETFRQKAAQFPGTFGAPGTPDMLRAQEQALRPQQEKLAQSLIDLPQGVTLPADITARAREFDTEFGKIGTAIDALKEKEQARRKAEREAEAERKREAREAEQAIRQEIQLTSQLAQVRAAMARTEQSAPERAAEQARARGAAELRTIDEALRQFNENPSLQQRAPQMRQEFEALKVALPGQIEVAALQAFNNSMEKDVIEPLRKLAGQHTQIKDDLDLIEAKKYAAAAANTVYAEETQRLVKALQESIQIEKQLPELRRQAAASAKTLEANQAFQARLDATEARLRAPKEEQEEIKLRMQARAQGAQPTEAQEAQMQTIRRLTREQANLNTAVEIWRDLSYGVGSAWVNMLSSIADKTMPVAEAFRAMGQSIMKTMSDIAAQQAFQAIFKLGTGLLLGAFTGGVTAGAGGNYGGIAQGYNQAAIPYDFGAFQHGGRINSPTLAMLGEGPSSTMPEYVLNRQQMDAVMSHSGGQGGQSISIHNYPSRAEAEAGAAQQRAQGHQAIVNSVLTDLQQGSGSRIGRMLRLSQT